MQINARRSPVPALVAWIFLIVFSLTASAQVPQKYTGVYLIGDLTFGLPTVSYSQFSANWQVTTNFSNGVTVQLDSISPVEFNADFASWNNTRLKPGFYTGTLRYPFNEGENGLALSNNFGAYNMCYGEFIVLEVTYGRNGAVTAFAADLLLDGDDAPNEENFCSIRWNSRFPLTTPSTIPTALSMPAPSGINQHVRGNPALPTIAPPKPRR